MHQQGVYQEGPLFLEDLAAGMHFSGPEWEVTAEDVIRFAREFDPQPHHVDPVAARDSFFGGLAASGWHTAAMIMGMAMRSDMQMTGGQVGIGVERLLFKRTVRPGDTLRLDIEILEARYSRSQPGWGVVKSRWNCFNQDGEQVMEIVPTALVRARESGPPAMARTDCRSGSMR